MQRVQTEGMRLWRTAKQHNHRCRPWEADMTPDELDSLEAKLRAASWQSVPLAELVSMAQEAASAIAELRYDQDGLRWELPPNTRNP